MSLHDPQNFARIVRGMINIQQHEGWLPECRGATAQQFIQGGSSTDSPQWFDSSILMTPTYQTEILYSANSS